MNTLDPIPPAVRQVVVAYARRRGVPDEGLEHYLNPSFRLDHLRLPDADKALLRLTRAIACQEPITLFGDYDCDGITSTSILLRFFRETAGARVDWLLPNRQTDHYGLGPEAAHRILARMKTGLLICVDCGTNSGQTINWLKDHGIDTVVIDHHPVQEDPARSAAALVNPKAHPPADPELSELCAAGLALLFCHRLAVGWGCQDRWDRVSATMLAGLGTLADSCPLTVVNRALVKTALGMLNDPAHLRRVQGLAALMPTEPGLRLNQRHLQFGAIPKLNALGRLGAADPGVELLMTGDERQVREIATLATEANLKRQELQQRVITQASTQAHQLLARPPQPGVLILADPGWHHGVLGPAASQLVERFGRSVLLLGPNGPGSWKGSGRSHNCDDLGRLVSQLRLDNLLERGGGHAAAVGIAATDQQLEELQRRAALLTVPQLDKLEPETELVGEADQCTTQEWQQALELLEPFGARNPFPHFSVRSGLLTDAPSELKLRDGTVWAAKAEFRTANGQPISVVWRDCPRARQDWQTGGYYDLELELSWKPYRGRPLFNWTVFSSMAAK